MIIEASLDSLTGPVQQTTPNLVIAKVGDGGKVSLFNFAGSTDLIPTSSGWFPSTASSVTPVIGDYSALYATAGEVTESAATGRHGQPEHVYAVSLDAAAVFGPDATHTLLIDIWERDLEDAT